MNTIPQKLIEKALNLTGKGISDVSFDDSIHGYLYLEGLFLTYLLSEEFCLKYQREVTPSTVYMVSFERQMGEAIYEYQRGNSQPLIDLLNKI